MANERPWTTDRIIIIETPVAEGGVKMDMPPLVINGELTPHAAWTLGRVLGAWLAFREWHDLESAKVCCCDKSLNLFEALRAYEALMTGEKK